MRRERNILSKIGVLLTSALLAGACGGMEEELEDLEGQEALEDGKADWASVKAKAASSTFTEGDDIPVTVTNGHQHSIYLPGCNEIGLQRLEGTTYKDVGPEKACFWEGFAVQVKGGATFSSSFFSKPAGTYRVKVAYKTSCAKQTPFSGCKATTRTSYSAKFTVKKDPCWGAWLDQNGLCRTPADGVYPPSCCTKCQPVLCELYCPNGFDVDQNGCEVCKCKPAPVDDCRKTGCASGKYCSFCWTKFQCIPNGAMC